jgi:hypothetical protein
VKLVRRAAVAVLLVLAAGTASSGATYTASGKNPQALGAAADFGLHVSVTDPGSPLRGTVNVSAPASATDGAGISQVVIQRSPAGAGSWTTICTDTVAAYSCSLDTTALANGQYDLRATATNGNGYMRTSAVVAARLVDNAAPTVSIDDPGAWFRATPTLTSSASDNAGGSGVANVRYEYKTSAGSTWNTACTGSTAPFSCSFNTASLANGTAYDFRAVATDAAGNATTSTAVTNRQFDGTAPSGSTTDPGANLRGTVTLAGTAADTHSGVASASVQYSPAGAGSWTVACVDTTTPFTSCNWDTTTVTTGLYDLRTVVTDVAGNTFTTATVASRRVDNVLPLVSLADPGSPLSGTITLNTTASDGESGMVGVTTQYSVAGAGAWANVCVTDTAPPYSCSANSAGAADGLYDFRAMATDVAGNVAYSTVTNRRIENAVPTGADVQTADGGGTPGVIQPGDSITLTYNEEMSPASIIAGWNGTGQQSINLRFAHHNQGDRIAFYNAANSAAIPLSASPVGVTLAGDYVPGSTVYSANLTRSADGKSFTATLVALTSGSVQPTAPAAGTMSWTPAAGAQDLAGKATSTTQKPELGAADAEF